MKKAAGLFLLGVSTLLGSAHALIDDGIVAKKNEFPSVVKILTYTPDGKDPEGNLLFQVGSCTGTLIARDVVLTASHCLVATPGVRQFVSLSGDSVAKLEKPADVIPVVGGVYSGAFTQNRAILEAINADIQSEEFKKLTPQDQLVYLIARSEVQNTMTAQDLAFLYLGKDQTGPNVKISKLGCRSTLVDGVEVTIAGYGQKFLKNSLVDTNEVKSLNYGTNVLSASTGPGKMYQILREEGKQLINLGDSGGPLFKKGDTSTVYGVASQRGDDPLTKQGMFGIYANLSSLEAHKFYETVLKDESIPKSLKKVLKDCQ